MTSITVTFVEPAMPNGVISSYRVCSFSYVYTCTSFSPCIQVTYSGSRSFDLEFSDIGTVDISVSEPVPSSFSITVPNLSPNTVYQLDLFAINGFGPGMMNTSSVATANGE